MQSELKIFSSALSKAPWSDRINPDGVSQCQLKVQEPKAFPWSPWRPQWLCWEMGKRLYCKTPWPPGHGTSMGIKRSDSVRTRPFYSIFQIKKVLIFTLNMRCQTSHLSPVSGWISVPLCVTPVWFHWCHTKFGWEESTKLLFFPSSSFFVWKLTAVNQQFAALPPRCGVVVKALKGNQTNLQYIYACNTCTLACASNNTWNRPIWNRFNLLGRKEKPFKA